MREPEAHQKKLEVKGASPIKSIESRFVLYEKIGEGGQATVYKAYDKQTKLNVAIKVTDKSHPKAVELVCAEVDHLRAAGNHANLVGLRGLYETADSYILAMDLADGGALFERILDDGNLSEAQASDYMLQITQAILHLHKRNMVHGDVKPENLLLTSEDAGANIKLCDFGMARVVSSGGFQVDYTIGTFDYWAPEIVRKQMVSLGIDMWALGVVMYVMLCGCNPFDPTAVASDSEILSSIANGKMDESNELWAELSPPCKDFIRGLLNVDASKRFTAEEALQHPWMVDQATSRDLPGVHQQRLLGFQALVMLRQAVKSLGLQADRLFELADVSQTGWLDIKELRALFKKIGMNLSDEALKAVTEIADISGDGRINDWEFARLMRADDKSKTRAMSERQLRQLFQIFDENGDGVIVAEELTHVLNMLGRRMSLDEAKQIVREATRKGPDAGLTFNDFSAVMRSKLLARKA